MHKIITLSTLLSLTLLASSPNPPSNLKLKALSANSVEISWSDNSNDELGFKILRDGDLIKTLPANITTFVDSGLKANTNYTYTVKSTDDTIDEPNLSGVHINEILASNVDAILDPDFYEFSDYIELKNYTNHSINIGGYKISDDKMSWTIPSGTTIAANGYILIWADERDMKGSALHTNFKLSSKKESVTLKDSSGNTIDKISYKKLPSNTSVRSINGKLAYMLPTPKADNKKVYTKLTISNRVAFSKNSGFYTSSQSVSLSAANGAKIYYTTDGSTPTVNSKRYTSPINISKTTVLKAIALESGKVASGVETKSYIIDLDTTLPIVSLSTDPDNLFDDYIGIYTDGKNGKSVSVCHDYSSDPKNFNQDWERPVFMEYFDENGQNIFSIGLDISISGQCSRFNAKKHFSFETSKSKYGEKYLEYALYPTKNIDKVKDFKLRGGEAGFQQRDIIASKLVELGNLKIDYQAYRAVRMFMNGEYWGVYNIREKKGKDYLKSNYPELGSDIDIIGNGVKHGDDIEYNRLHDFIKNHDLANDSNYQQILNMIDMDNFIDYMILMTYSGNRDWYDNNFRCWRERKDGAKWRWMLDDLDYGFIIPDRSNFDLATKSGMMMTDLFRKLLRNSTFKNRFKSRYYYLLDNVFTSSNMLQIIDDIVNERRAYMNLEGKWGITQGMFDNDVERLRDFARNRERYIRDQLNNL